MAKITLNDLRHSYMAEPKVPADYALKRLDVEWRDGGAYALLGPSGCGKTTLLNIISGLLIPSHGKVLFGERDVTRLPTDERNIAQVFQFPVVYDTMSVYDNLAFPLRNRGVPELTGMLSKRASGLTADGKQKISLGRGLVREDVNVIMFDEPLTVIDPHLKWLLRSKLKELHQKLGTTMIYVTHDQTEALTFADQVVVMKDGEVVQIGTPVELFEQPRHTFVGHFIGSPGMNIIPCQVSGGQVHVGAQSVAVGNAAALTGRSGGYELGVRPEFTSFAKDGLPVQIAKVTDTGRSRIVEARHGQVSIKLLVAEGAPIPSESAFLAFDRAHAHIYDKGWLAE
jgi:glycerol transport system ATP-binding protein